MTVGFLTTVTSVQHWRNPVSRDISLATVGTRADHTS